MTAQTKALAPGIERGQAVSNAVLGMIVFIVMEVMLFGALMSAFVIAESSAPSSWPPAGQPRLPIWETAINTAALLLSGYVLLRAARAYRGSPERARRPLALAIALGAFFVIFQGMEWLALIREGLTLTTSVHGSFFYLIVGTHASHAVAALIALVYAYRALQRDTLTGPRFQAIRIFWYFVVCVWPVLYLKVYL